MNPNDPLFRSTMHTWCPNCGKQHSGIAGDLCDQPRIACNRCSHAFAVDIVDLEAEIAARRVAAASRRRLAYPTPGLDREWEFLLYAVRGQRPLEPHAVR